MTAPLHVLVYGSIGGGVCDFYRLGMYRERLAALGVEMREWGEFNDYAVRVPAGYETRLRDAVRDGVAEIDRGPIDWADVIVFRRWYPTAPACETCDTVGTAESIAEHAAATGHAANTPDLLLPLLLTTFDEHPEALRGRALVYETDDDLLAGRPWLPFYRRLQVDRPLVERLMRHADLITVTTPVLARSAQRFNDEVRVVRNAIDPSWYAGVEPDGHEGVRFLYYGSGARLRDYAVCRDSVDAVAKIVPGMRRVWLGSNDPVVRAAVDEAHDYVEGVPAFARALAGTHPDVGVAPVIGDDFDRAHSELHWLEYTMAGAATVASRTPGGGPYDVIRDGVDGLLARKPAEWHEALRRLATSASLREELAGRARERVLAEYQADRRAEEWRDAFMWAAEHGGRAAVRKRAATPRHQQPLVTERDRLAERTAAEAPDNLRYRLRSRADAAEAVQRLEELRAGRDVCWPDGADTEPLVSVIIPTYNRGRILVDRAIASVLAQTYPKFELIVVGDCATPETVAAIESVHDPRLRWENLPTRSPRPDDPERAWQISGSRPYNRCLDLARGQWIAPLADDDEFTPNHLATLLAAAIVHRLEFVYGLSWMEAPDGTWFQIGEWPPRLGGFAAGAMIYSGALKFMHFEEECWREDEPNDWNLWRRMIEAGVKTGFLKEIVFRHYVEARHRLKAS